MPQGTRSAPVSQLCLPENSVAPGLMDLQTYWTGRGKGGRGKGGGERGEGERGRGKGERKYGAHNEQERKREDVPVSVIPVTVEV